MRYLIALILVLGFLAPAPALAEDPKLVIYSGRSKSLVDPLVRRFEKTTGIEVEVRYGKTAQLAIALQEEGERSPADLFWAQDAGALGAVTDAGLFAPLPEATLNKVGERYREEEGRWIATSGRARLLAYSPARVEEDQLPESVFELTADKWKGRVGWAPTNGSFQAFVTAMRSHHGEKKTRAWLEAMKENGARPYPKNTAIIQGLAAGEVDLGLPNHYYLLRFKTADKEFPVEQTFFEPGDIGNLVNIAGAGVLKTSERKDHANRFINFLLDATAQQYFTAYVFEYPVIDGVIPHPKLVDNEQLNELAPEVDLGDLDDLEGTLKMLREAGLL